MCIRDMNDGAANPTFTAADIATSADGAREVNVADIDGDGDLDIVSASDNEDTIAWYENQGAAGNHLLTIADVTASNENAANATFTVSLSAAVKRDVTVDYATSNGTATAGADYTATSGTLTIAAGATSGTFNVPVLADALDEANETATITLSNASNASISDSTATLTITDDDPNPSITIADVTTSNENASNATFTVSLSAASTVTIDCETLNVFALTTGQNTTFVFSNPPASGTAYGFTLKLTAGGGHTITYPGSVDFAGGTAPDAPASGETDVLVFITVDGGTNWYGALAIDAAG